MSEIDNGVNVENMLALADLIERCDSFDLNTWGRELDEDATKVLNNGEVCGTVCCIAGWENVRIKTRYSEEYLADEERFLRTYYPGIADERMKALRAAIKFDDREAARASLGLTWEQSDQLFFRTCWFWNTLARQEHGGNHKWSPNAQEAADVLRRIANNELSLDYNAEDFWSCEDES